jgi:hypothetical protein
MPAPPLCAAARGVAMPPAALASALCVAAGAAALGWALGSAAFARLFDVLWANDLERLLDGRGAAFAFPGLAAALGFGVGWRVALDRARREGPAGGPAALLALAGIVLLAALGAGAVGHVAAQPLLRALPEGIAKDDLIAAMLACTFLPAALAGGVAAFAERRRFGRGALAAALAVAAVAVAPVLAIVLNLTLSPDRSRYARGLDRPLDFELRLPDGTTLTETEPVRIRVLTDRDPEPGYLYKAKPRLEGGRAVAAGFAWLRRPAERRALVIAVAGGPEHRFDLRLPAKPAGSETFGPWQTESGPAWTEGGAVQIRYRVRPERRSPG